MDLHQDYINDIDIQVQSPSSSHNNNNNDSFDSSSFDFATLHSPNNFPHTPSYNGSYQNSPFSAHSELSFGNPEPPDFSLFDDAPHQSEDYDPAEYDPPHSNSLLMFDSDFMNNIDSRVSVSVNSAQFDNNSPHSFDYSSPSSNGGADSGPEGERRSRASSVSSNHHSSAPTSRLDVAQNFENLRFDSPHWASHPLPLDRPLSPSHKPQSPPQLLIPDSTSPSGTSMFPQSPPIINAPAGDSGVMASGLQLHIVPATPVSGGGAGATSQPVPFQQRLETLHPGSASKNQPTNSSWNHTSQQSAQQDQSTSLAVQYPEDAQVSFPFPQHSHNSASPGLSTSSTQINSHSQNDNNYLFPTLPRSRSKSDTSAQPPQWNNHSMSHNDHNNDHSNSALDDSYGTVNMSDILSPSGALLPQHPSSAGPLQTTFGDMNLSQPHLAHHFTYGPPGTISAQLPNNFLSPDLSSNLRRSKSDHNPRLGHRQSRSEDMRHSHIYPPSSQQEFISRQFLHPQEPVPPARGHVRRASSGSRGDRKAMGAPYSTSSSTRASPYPSPSVSPMFRNDDLPNVSLSGRHGNSGLLPQQTTPHLQPTDLDAMSPGPGGTSVIVSKPNVTTGRTADASHRRRKQEANFMCPVPGCGSTFTRSFNLKGHLRSHNEEKPFQCKWPGCGKGFARQHDCKRHEQLHSNYRPFTCDGCRKNFARMDALNRHLRSEGGAECQRILTESGGNGRMNNIRTSLTKTEGDNGWPGTVMV